MIHRVIFGIFFVAGIVGCKLQPDSLHARLNPSQTSSTPESISSLIEQSQTPFFSTPKPSEKIVMPKNPTDSLLTAKAGNYTNSLVAPIEISTLLPNGSANSPSNGSESEAAYVLMGQQARGQVILPKVPLVSQPDFTACGEAAFAMGWNYRHPDWNLDVGMVEAAGLTLQVYFPASSARPRGYLGTSPAGMEAIGNFYVAKYDLHLPTVGNIYLDKGAAYARLEAKGLLYSQLSSGNPVIIEVTDSIGNPSKIYNDSHYVIVTGMNFDSGIVTYNDPLIAISMSGKYSGYGRLAQWGQIWISWFNNRDINPGQSGHPGRGWYMIVQ